MTETTKLGDMLNTFDIVARTSEELDEEVYVLQSYVDFLNTSFINLKEKRQTLETFVKQLAEELSILFPEEKV